MRAAAPLSLLLLAPLGCIASRTERVYPVPSTAGTTSPAAAKKDDPTAKRATLTRSLALEEQKLQKARFDLENQEVSSRDAVAKSEAELELATAKLALFEESEAPARLQKERLDLHDARDSLDDAQEELAQLEMMYGEEDLADKTREIVLRRGQRRLERSRKRLELKERELRTLEAGTLPQDRTKLVVEKEEKGRALEAARRAAEASLLEKRIGLVQVENEMARLREEIAALETAKQP